MNYKGQDIDLKSGDLILYRNEFMLFDTATWLSAVVRFFTKSPVNHTAVVVTNWGVTFLNEALDSGVISRPALLHLERSKSKIVVRRKKTPVAEKDFCVFANSYLGTPYDYESLLIQQPVYRVTHDWIGSKDSPIALECAEYAAMCHGLPNYSMYSTKELFTHPDFDTIYSEL